MKMNSRAITKKGHWNRLQMTQLINAKTLSRINVRYLIPSEYSIDPVVPELELCSIYNNPRKMYPLNPLHRTRARKKHLGKATSHQLSPLSMRKESLFFTSSSTTFISASGLYLGGRPYDVFAKALEPSDFLCL